MKKYIFCLLSLFFIFSALHLSAKESVVLEATETRRTIEYRFPVEYWDSTPPGYRIEMDYELTVDDGVKLFVNLWTYEQDGKAAYEIYENFTISPGDTLNFDVISSDGFDENPENFYVLFELRDLESVPFMKGFSRSWEYFGQ